jgi:hypothetical protein
LDLSGQQPPGQLPAQVEEAAEERPQPPNYQANGDLKQRRPNSE